MTIPKRIMRAVKTRLLFMLLALAASTGGQAAEKAMSPEDSVRITVARGRDVTDVKDGSIGEKLAEFKPVVKLQNESFADFNHNKVCLIMIGDDATVKGNLKVIYRREFEADLPAGKTFEWTGESFKQGFDHTLSTSGFDYSGYIVIIKNSEGKFAVVGATKPAWIRDVEKAWGLEAGKEYNKKYFQK